MAKMIVCDRCGISIKDEEEFVLSMHKGMAVDRAELCEKCAEELMKALSKKTLKLRGMQCRTCKYYCVHKIACTHPMMRVYMPPDGFCSRWEREEEENEC